MGADIQVSADQRIPDLSADRQHGRLRGQHGGPCAVRPQGSELAEKRGTDPAGVRYLSLIHI